MEIPRPIRYAFSSPDGRRKMNKRKKIIQDMFDTIILSHTPQERSTTRPNTSEPALYRGTLLGWVVLGTLRPDPVLTSGYSYHPSVAPATLDFDYANLFPLIQEKKDPDIKRALKRIKRKDGLRINRRQRRELITKLSERVTVQINPKDTYPPSSTIQDYLETNHNVIRIPIMNLSQWSIDHLKNQIGINPVDIAQQLQNI